jgi:hypothetical protein
MWNYATNMPFFDDWISVAYGNGIFVAVVYNSNIAAYSYDGINWTAITLPYSRRWNIKYTGGRFFVIDVGSSFTNESAYSDNGITWVAAKFPTSGRWSLPSYGDKVIVSVSRLGQSAYMNI